MKTLFGREQGSGGPRVASALEPHRIEALQFVVAPVFGRASIDEVVPDMHEIAAIPIAVSPYMPLAAMIKDGVPSYYIVSGFAHPHPIDLR